MERVQRDGEQRALLPFECVLLALPLLPNLGRAPALDHENDFFIEMPFGIERTGAGDLHDVAAPKAFRAVKLDVGSAPAEAAPWLHGQVLHPAHADAAIDRHALRFHEAVVGHGLSLERAE